MRFWVGLSLKLTSQMTVPLIKYVYKINIEIQKKTPQPLTFKYLSDPGLERKKLRM